MLMSFVSTREVSEHRGLRENKVTSVNSCSLTGLSRTSLRACEWARAHSPSMAATYYVISKTNDNIDKEKIIKCKIMLKQR